MMEPLEGETDAEVISESPRKRDPFRRVARLEPIVPVPAEQPIGRERANDFFDELRAAHNAQQKVVEGIAALVQTFHQNPGKTLLGVAAAFAAVPAAKQLVQIRRKRRRSLRKG
jgi:hypothetical protein